MSSTFYLLLNFITGSLHLTIKEIDAPSTVVLAGRAELRCEFEAGLGDLVDWGSWLSEVQWWRWPLELYERQELIYDRLEGQPPRLMNHDNIQMGERDTIVIDPASARDSGVYQCRVLEHSSGRMGRTDERRNHTLVVYSPGSLPYLEVDRQGNETDTLSVRCYADDVTPEPYLEITMNGEEMQTRKFRKEPKNGMWSVSAIAAVAIGNAKEINFVCEQFYFDEDLVHPSFTDEYIYTNSQHSQEENGEDGDDTDDFNAEK